MKFLFYKALILAVAFACSTSEAPAQTYADLIKSADSLYHAGEYKASMTHYLQAFEIESTIPGDLYNGARSAAKAGSHKAAIFLLKLAIDSGWTDIDRLNKDEDWALLRESPEWTTLIEDLQKKLNGVGVEYDPMLQQELLYIHEDDQRIRQIYMASNPSGPRTAKLDSLARAMNHADSINLVKVKSILDTHGWVGTDVVGDKASDALFLVIQHADLQSQIKYLPLLKDAVSRKVARADNLALLEDRIAIRHGRKQLYGTQLQRNDKTGKFFFMPIEDAKNVDKRRAAVGLGPISEYASTWGIEWNATEYGSLKE